MDGPRFDEWVRATARQGATRRAALRLMAGGALGGLLVRFGLGEAAAACARVGQRCARNYDCCDGEYCHTNRCRCRPDRDRCRRRCCSTGETCVEGACRRCATDGQCVRFFPDRQEQVPCCGTDVCSPDGVCTPCLPKGGDCREGLPEQCCSGTCNIPAGQSTGTCT